MNKADASYKLISFEKKYPNVAFTRLELIFGVIILKHEDFSPTLIFS